MSGKATSHIEEINKKFEQLKKMGVEETGKVWKGSKATVAKFMRVLVDAVDDLSDASEEAAEERNWEERFEIESNKMLASFHAKWNKLQEKFYLNTKEENYDDLRNSRKPARKQRQNSKSLDMSYYDDEGYFSEEEDTEAKKTQNQRIDTSYKRSNQID